MCLAWETAGYRTGGYTLHIGVQLGRQRGSAVI
jgi:hypothetical protein